MPEPFPWPNSTNWTTVLDLFEYVNRGDVIGTDKGFGVAMVALVWIVGFASFNPAMVNERVTKPLMASSFMAFAFAVMLWPTGFVPTYAVGLTFTGLLLAVLADKIQEES